MSFNKDKVIVETVDEKSTTPSIKSQLYAKTPKYCRDRAKRHLSNRLSTKLLCKMSGQPTFVKQSAFSMDKQTPTMQPNATQSVPVQITPATADVKPIFKIETSQSRHTTHIEREETGHS